MNYTIHRLDSVSSTNDFAMQMARDGAPEGTVIVAREQTAGRGRHGRSWLSPEGGLYLSVVLRPEILIEQVWQIGFVASLSAAEAVEEVSGIPAHVKWPNDVFLNGRKVCGILIETVNRTSNVQLPTSNVQQVVVGIGINIESRAFPKEIADKVTSICAEGEYNLSAFDVEDALLEALDRRYDEYAERNFPPILNAWKLLDCTTGRKIEAHTPDGIIRGTALEVDSTGSLIVDSDGKTVRITAGDVLLPNC